MNTTAQAPPGDSHLVVLGRHQDTIFNKLPRCLSCSLRLRNRRSKSRTVSRSRGLAHSPTQKEVLGERPMMALRFEETAGVGCPAWRASSLEAGRAGGPLAQHILG